MKKSLLSVSLSATLAVHAQKTSTLFEVTDPVKGGFNWSAIRQVTGSEAAGPLIIDGRVAKGSVIDAKLQQKKGDFSPNSANYKDQPLYSGVAALAYDKGHDRLYYVTMFTQELRYISLGKNQAAQYFQAGNIADVIKSREPGYKISHEQQGPVITRMAIGADGYGYGISNDGLSFFRFSLNRKTEMTELGSLVDDSKNGSVSVHSQCSSWGGDIVGSADGDLYLFTTGQQVFRINPVTKITTYLGKLNGLDPKFTVNGAAVNDEGKVVLSTAAYAGTRAIVEDMSSLTTTLANGEGCGNASDLASSNLLFSNNSKLPVIGSKEITDKAISVFPNPITNGFALVRFDKLANGRFTIDILNGAGGNVQRKSVTLGSEGQQVRLNTTGLAKGIYVVKVTDASRKEVFNSKLVIQ